MIGQRILAVLIMAVLLAILLALYANFPDERGLLVFGAILGAAVRPESRT